MILPLSVLSLLLTSPLPQSSQDAVPTVDLASRVQHVGAVAPAPGTARLIVQFDSGALDLSGYRAAVAAERADELKRVVADLEQRAVDSRQAFAKAIERLGGKVEIHYWLVDACCVTVPAAQRDEVAHLPGAVRVEDDQPRWVSIQVATNATHHNSDLANTRLINSVPVKGRGIGVAILDTGADRNMGGTGRPHALYYPGGNPANQTGGGLNGSYLKAALGIASLANVIEDGFGHGSWCAACAGAGGWPSAFGDGGSAPECDKVSVKCFTDAGQSNTSLIMEGWLVIATNRLTYNIRVANASFGGPGSNSLLDSAQQAMDSLAFNGDVLIVSAAGNDGAAGTANSQRNYNGMSVGSINKNTLAWSSFSSIGPIAGGATFPDLAAVGAAVIMPALDNDAGAIQADGTSFSSPFAAGVGALVRQVGGTTMKAIDAKALILNYTQNIGANRNQIGVGMLKANLAVDAAIGRWSVRDTVTTATSTKSFTFNLNLNEQRSVTIAWMRNNVGSATTDNLDLRIFDPSNALVVQGNTVANSYEKVTFTATVAGQYRADVVGVTLTGGSREFAIAGAVQSTPPQPPTLTSVTPNAVPNFQPPQITLVGTNLATVTSVQVGTQNYGVPQIIDNQTVRLGLGFPPPALGTVNVTVTNPAGTSNAVQLTWNPVTPPALTGPTLLVSNQTSTFNTYGAANVAVLLWFSGDRLPSSIPGFIDLVIGNNFTTLVLLTSFGSNAGGFGFTPIHVPAGSSGVHFYLQATPIDVFNFTPPILATNDLACFVIA